MKFHKFTNYFNALSPSLEEHEEEIFFHHPVLPDVYCNQLGALYVDEDRYKVKQTRAGVNIEDKKGLVVATGHGALLIEQIQFPGAKVMLVADWLLAGRTQLTTKLVLQ